MYIPLTCRTTYSLGKSLWYPSDLIEKAKKYDYPAVGLMEDGNLASCVQFYKECAKTSIKPIIGSHIQVVDGTIGLIARNKDGWRSLLKCSSLAHGSSLSQNQVAENSIGLIAITGHFNSSIANLMFTNPYAAYNARTYDDAKSIVSTDWKVKLGNEIDRLKSIFGENLYLQTQLYEKLAIPAMQIVSKTMAWASKNYGVRLISSSDIYYGSKEDAVDQRVMLCSITKSTLDEVRNAIQKQNLLEVLPFVQSNHFYLPTKEELPGEYNRLDELVESVEKFDILNRPIIPKFPDTPTDQSSSEFLTSLCLKGLADKKLDKKQEYIDRLNRELKVLLESGLSDYFLVVQDFCEKFPHGKGRGSAAGCLVSYLTKITSVDPILYDLSFERFYNAGRNTKDRIAMPDIDVDFPKRCREDVIAYVEKKYGLERVAHLCTVNRIQGRAALKDVFRAHSRCSKKEMDIITKCIPQESTIQDKLQECRDAGESDLIIMWALNNLPGKFREWCYVDPTGEFQGPFAMDFKQALRLEGAKRQFGKHASGIVVSHCPIDTVCPMITDKNNGGKLVGVEMNDADALGLPKFDILSTVVLDKILDTIDLIRYGEFS